MQISISIEPYLTEETKKLKEYIESVIRLSRKMAESKCAISLHFDYFKFNPAVFELVQSYTSEIDIDLHLMQEPVTSVEGFRSVSFDVNDLEKGLETENNDQLKANMEMVDVRKRGLVLDLGYRVSDYKDLIQKTEYIIVMTVKCGKSGQVLQESALSLVADIREINPRATIIIDGGVNPNNINLIQKTGVDVVVVGNYAKKCYENGVFEEGINRLLQD